MEMVFIKYRYYHFLLCPEIPGGADVFLCCVHTRVHVYKVLKELRREGYSVAVHHEF